MVSSSPHLTLPPSPPPPPPLRTMLGLVPLPQGLAGRHHPHHGFRAGRVCGPRRPGRPVGGGGEDASPHFASPHLPSTHTTLTLRSRRLVGGLGGGGRCLTSAHYASTPPPPPCMLTLVVKVTSLGVLPSPHPCTCMQTLVKVTSLGVELFLPLAVVGLAVRECDLGWGGTCV